MALLQADRSGMHADRLPAGAEVQPEAAPDVVEDQRGAGPRAQLAQAAGELRVDELLIEAGVVLERADHDAGQVGAGLAAATVTEARSLNV